MTINKINGVPKIGIPQKISVDRVKQSIKKSDTVSFSPNAKEILKSDADFGNLRNSDVIRWDKVDQAKANLAKYFSNAELPSKIADNIAEKIVDSFII